MTKLVDTTTDIGQVMPTTFEEVDAKVTLALEIGEDLEHETRRHGRIFSMLQRMYAHHIKELETRIQQLEEVKFKRYRYYNGKASGEEYKAEPLRETILKSDIDQWMRIDKFMVAAKKRVAEQELIVKYLEGAKDMHSKRSHLLNTALAFRRMNLGLG